MRPLRRIKKALLRLAVKTLFPVDSVRGWLPVFQESFTGAFQTDDPVALGEALAHPTVFACVTQIAADIGKLRLGVMEYTGGVWVESPLKLPVLKRPNKFQIRQKFIESWLISKLTYGNAYVLKVRNPDGTVKMLYVLDPQKVEPLIATNGDVFYRLRQDHLTTVHVDIDAVPASEIIHDTMECLFHPLVGVPPLYAASMATSEGLAIQRNSTKLFQNGVQPGGMLTAPGHIKKETADRLKAEWATGYTGDNAGKIAILGDGLEFKHVTWNATDAELMSQLKWSDEKICSAYKVPPYKVHVGKPPTYQQSETLDRKYFSDCLQRLIESIESLLNEGLSLPDTQTVEFNLDDLMRMDMALKMQIAADGVKGGIFSPNEGRRRFNLLPTKGGESPYLQQQNYSLRALHERDMASPLAAKPDPPPQDETEKALLMLFRKDIISCLN